MKSSVFLSGWANAIRPYFGVGRELFLLFGCCTTIINFTYGKIIDTKKYSEFKNQFSGAEISSSFFLFDLEYE